MISEDLERTTRDVILEDRGLWGPHQTSILHALPHSNNSGFLGWQLRWPWLCSASTVVFGARGSRLDRAGGPARLRPDLLVVR